MTKAAILIDGGYLLKRLPSVRPDIDATDPEAVARSIKQLVRGHLSQLNEVHGASDIFQLLYRTFYYDAKPYSDKDHLPVSEKSIDYNNSPQAQFRRDLFKQLRAHPNLAVRLGHVIRVNDHPWAMNAQKQKQLLRGEAEIADLGDDDFRPNFRQKGVDMRIGLDIASITLKRQASIIILVSGDADFVPAAKLARREGVQFILDPLWHSISDDLSEHIDRLRSGFGPPRS